MIGYPIVLPNAHISRILDRRATVLILGRRLSLGPARHEGSRRWREPRLYELHNALTMRQNLKHCRNGRRDLQTDPHVLTIELATITTVKFEAVTERQARDAGYQGVEDFRVDWRRRHRSTDLDSVAHVHLFRVTDERYLHQKVHLGYTNDASQGVSDVGAALSDEDLEVYSRRARERDELIRAARRAEMPMEERIRDLSYRAKRGSRDAKQALFVIRQRLEREARKREQAA